MVRGTAQENRDTRTFVGPYRVSRKLGGGGMGVVYEGAHSVTGERVAVKTVRAPTAWLLASIRREIHALSRLRHPGVARIVGEGVHEGLPYYAMELCGGETLRDRLDVLYRGGKKSRPEASTFSSQSRAATVREATPGRSAPESDCEPPPRRTMAEILPVLSLVRSVCAPLAYLHGEGIVHCDLKPTNIVIRPDGTPVLVDLGVARSGGISGRDELGAAGAIGGSVGYMAPEQVRGDLLDPRADLYALGIILYEILTGHRPFVGGTIAVKYQQLAGPPEPPSGRNEGVPPALDALVLRLLAKKPEDRLGHAEDVDAVLAELDVPVRGAPPTPPPRAYLYRPTLAGRDAALAVLERALDRTVDVGRGQRVFVGGESGVGKTRLALELAARATQRSMRVVMGECAVLGADGTQDSVAPPLRPLQPLLLAIADRCGEDPTQTAALLGVHGKVLAPYAPALLDLPGQREAPDPPPLSPEASRGRLLDAVRERVLSFGEAGPVLLVLDDVQWADELSIALLRMLHGHDFEASGVLVLCLYRVEDLRGELADVVRAPGSEAIVLDRLDDRGVAAMVSGMLALPEAPAALLRLLHHRSGGNPFFASEYLRAAVAGGDLVREGGRWRLRAPEDAGAMLARLDAPPSITELLERRLRDLDPRSRALVTLAAVFGCEVDAALLLTTASMDEADAAEAIETLRFHQIFEARDGDRVRFTHDKLREAAYAQAPAEERARLHRCAAKAIEAAGGSEDRYDALAFHYRRATMAHEARAYAELAGRRAFATGVYRKAVEHLAVALDLAPAAHGPSAPRGSSSSRGPRGEPHDAVQRGELLYMYGQSLYDVGEIEQSGARLLEALATLGLVRMPVSKVGWGALFARETIKQAVLRAVPPAWVEVPEARRPAYTLSALATRPLEFRYIFNDQFFEVIGLRVLAANLAERGRDPSLMLAATSRMGLNAGLAGLHRVARFYFDSARRMHAKPELVAYELENARDEGYYAYAVRGDWAEARAILQRLLDRCLAVGDVHQTEATYVALAQAGMCAGDGKGREHARALCVSAERHGHGLHGAWGHEFLAANELALGEFESALRHFAPAEHYFRETGGVSYLFEVFAGTAEARRQLGDLDGALAKLAEGRAAVAARPSVQAWCILYNQLAPDIYVEAWERAEARGESPGELPSLVRQAGKAARRASRTFACLVPAALRAAANLAAKRHQRRRASRLLQESAARAHALAMPRDEAISRARLAQLGLGTSLDERILALDRARSIFVGLRGEPGERAPELDGAVRALQQMSPST